MSGGNHVARWRGQLAGLTSIGSRWAVFAAARAGTAPARRLGSQNHDREGLCLNVVKEIIWVMAANRCRSHLAARRNSPP